MDPVEYASQLYAFELAQQSFLKMVEAINKIEGLDSDVSTGQSGTNDLVIAKTTELKNVLELHMDVDKETIISHMDTKFSEVMDLLIRRFDSVDSSLVTVNRKLDDYFLSFNNSLSVHNDHIDQMKLTQEAIKLSLDVLTDSHKLSDDLIESLRTAVRETDTGVENLKSTIEVLSTASSQAVTSISKLDANVGSFSGMLRSNNEAMATMNGNVIDINDKLGHTNSKISALDVFMNTVIAGQNAMNPKFAAIMARFVDMEHDHEGLDNRAESLEDLINVVNTSLSQDMQGFKWKYNQILKQLMITNSHVTGVTDISMATTFAEISPSITFNDIDPELTFSDLANN